MKGNTLTNLLNAFLQDIRKSCRTTSTGTAWNDIGEAGTFRRTLARLLVRYTSSFTVEEMTQKDAVWTLTLNMERGEQLRFTGWRSRRTGATVKMNGDILITTSPAGDGGTPQINGECLKTLMAAI